MLPLAVLLTFGAVFLFVAALASGWGRARQTREQLVLARLTGGRAEPVPVRLFRSDTMSSLPALHRWLSRVRAAARLKRWLEQAAISQPVGLVIAVVLLLTILGGHLGWRLTASWAWVALGAGVGACLPLLYLMRRRRKRLNLYTQQLPEALDALVRSLRAGHSFLQGIHSVGREMPDPAGTEFRMTFEALRLGRSLREALQAHGERVDSLDFNLVATSLLIQREVGGNLAEILENVSQTIRERFKLLGQIRTLSAQNWLAGRIICLLPFAIGAMVYLMRRELILVLFREEAGKTLMAVALGMQILGFFVMKRIMTIKV